MIPSPLHFDRVGLGLGGSPRFTPPTAYLLFTASATLMTLTFFK